MKGCGILCGSPVYRLDVHVTQERAAWLVRPSVTRVRGWMMLSSSSRSGRSLSISVWVGSRLAPLLLVGRSRTMLVMKTWSRDGEPRAIEVLFKLAPRLADKRSA